MSMFARLLLSGGLSAEEYDSIRGDIANANLRNLMVYAPVACVFFCMLSVASLLTTQGPPSMNHMIYLVSCLVTGAMIPCAHVLARTEASRHPRTLLVLVYAFMVALYVFSITLSVSHTSYPAVSAIVFLLVNPMLFIDRPVRVMASTVVAIAAVCVTSICTKDIALATDDVWNAVTFGAVALTVGALSMRTKITQIYQAREISYLSKMDALTQLHNRNNFEARLEDYPQSKVKTIACAYADANGLHELNNTKGHDAGDELLRTIAREMRKQFGEKDTYRIGGDEFVAIVPNGSADEVRRRLQTLREDVTAQGYSVSCGASEVEASRANMRALVREAEQEMYAQKRKLAQER